MENLTALRKEATALSKTFADSWEQNFPFLQKFLSLLKKDIVKLPEFFEYKKIWMAHESGFNGAWEKEENSVLNQIFAEIYAMSKNWLDPQNRNPWKSFLTVASETLIRLSNELKDQTWPDGYKNHFKASEENFIEEFNHRNIVDLEEMMPPIHESRKQLVAERLTADNFKLLKSFFERIELAIGKEKMTGDADWRNLLQILVQDSGQRNIDDHIGSESVYMLAKRIDIDYRKLLYILRKIKFPMKKFSYGRCGNHVLKSNLPLFDSITSEIKMIFSHERNFRGWIDYFKNKHGWKKSRISKFMTSRIKRGNIPPNFFEILEPPPSRKLFSHLTNDRGGIRELFEALPAQWDVFGKQHTIKNRLLELRRVCIKATETLLTAGMQS